MTATLLLALTVFAATGVDMVEALIILLGGYALAIGWVAAAIASFAPALSAETMPAVRSRYDLLDS